MARKKEYEVIGPHAVDGHDPGQSFTASYSPEHERFLIEAGHIRIKAKEEK